MIWSTRSTSDDRILKSSAFAVSRRMPLGQLSVLSLPKSDRQQDGETHSKQRQISWLGNRCHICRDEESTIGNGIAKVRAGAVCQVEQRDNKTVEWEISEGNRKSQSLHRGQSNVAESKIGGGGQQAGDKIIVGVECLCLRRRQTGIDSERSEKNEVIGRIAYRSRNDRCIRVASDIDIRTD